MAKTILYTFYTFVKLFLRNIIIDTDILKTKNLYSFKF